MDYPLISAETPGELDSLSFEMIALIRQLRSEKAGLHRLERERVMLPDASQTLRDEIDARIALLDKNRQVLCSRIAKLAPGYDNALQWAIHTMKFDEAIGTIRYNYRRDGCFTFGMPNRLVMAVWVQGGSVVRAEPIDQ